MAAFRERGDREDPRAGRQGPGDLRPLGRRRFSVAAVLIHEAIGDQLTCVFVDHGLMRRARREVVACSATTTTSRSCTSTRPRLFLGALEGVSDPETKRKTIGRLFIDVFEEGGKKIGGAEFLAQGTLYPDVIESVSSPAARR
jgi:GMP synthase (glutamine-hydrolysing)